MSAQSCLHTPGSCVPHGEKTCVYISADRDDEGAIGTENASLNIVISIEQNERAIKTDCNILDPMIDESRLLPHGLNIPYHERILACRDNKRAIRADHATLNHICMFR